MLDQTSVPDAAIAGRDNVRNVVQGLLRGAQRQGWTDDSLHTASGVPARTIKSYRVEGKEPCLTNALSLGLVLGPKAVNAILAVIGYGGAKPLDECDAPDIRNIVANVLPHLSTIAEAARDGTIDHLERPGTQAAADQILVEILPLTSAGAAT